MITYLFISLLLIIGIAAVAYMWKKKRHNAKAPQTKVSNTLPIVIDAPVEPAAPILKPDSIISRKNNDNFVQYAEVLALGPEWANVWWCSNTLPQAGMLDISVESILWPIIGNVGCDAHGLIHFGQGAPGRGFEYRDATGDHMGHLSYFPPVRYEYRTRTPSADLSTKSLRPVNTRSAYGFPAVPAEKAYYLDELVYRARIYNEIKDANGVIVAYMPVPVEQHGQWLAEKLKARGWSPKRPESGPLGPEWDIGN